TSSCSRRYRGTGSDRKPQGNLLSIASCHETNSEWLGSTTMMERWWCIDCKAAVELNVYGRCEHCDSDAVDSMERIPLKAKAATAQIEALLASSACGSN